MMLYEYRCDQCGNELEAIRKIDDRHLGPVCPTCGETATLVIRTAPHGYVDNMKEYVCPVTKEPITTRRQRNYSMEKNDLADANDYKQSWQDRAEKKRRKQEEMRRLQAEIPQELRSLSTQLAKEERARLLG